MVNVKRLVLDVLKPHNPNCLEFAKAIGEIGSDYLVRLVVEEVDEKTETLNIEISGSSIDYPAVESAITNLGGAIHSIDEVDVENNASVE